MVPLAFPERAPAIAQHPERDPAILDRIAPLASELVVLDQRVVRPLRERQRRQVERVHERQAHQLGIGPVHLDEPPVVGDDVVTDHEPRIAPELAEAVEGISGRLRITKPELPSPANRADIPDAVVFHLEVHSDAVADERLEGRVNRPGVDARRLAAASVRYRPCSLRQV